MWLSVLGWLDYPMDPKCNHKYSCENDTQGDLTLVKQKAFVTKEQRDWSCVVRNQRMLLVSLSGKGKEQILS